MADRPSRTGRCPSAASAGAATGWWGMLFIMLTEGALFAYLLFGYYYLAVQPHGSLGRRRNAVAAARAPEYVILLVSSVAAWWGERGIKTRRRRQLALGFGGGVILGGIFVGIQLVSGTTSHSAVVEHLRLALFHHHRLPYGARRRRAADADRAVLGGSSAPSDRYAACWFPW